MNIDRVQLLGSCGIFPNLEMTQFEEKYSEHIFRRLYVVRNAANYLSLMKYKDDFNQDYWILVFNNFYDTAMLEWGLAGRTLVYKLTWELN
ncbi:MAG: hypothetical protein KJ550_07865 [Proteobacteria bacterium]|nr:hypothetical protein [Desulfobacteraceae bacterium]MBU4013367.1 hypothetical protein [Pseudomonadota bacterium]MBU4068510.1 hypothetical protein [Pseudomonadota bacterium]MBU4099954.1 hypothetical protein [Pseudomonadota bacterium]